MTWNHLVRPVAYITADFKKLVFDPGSTLVESESIKKKKNETIIIAPKHNSSLETFPYAIQKHLTMRQSDFTLQIPKRKVRGTNLNVFPGK